MANTTSAKKATRKIARRHHYQQVASHPDARRKSALSKRRSRAADRDAALKAMTRAEPETHAGRPAQHHPQEQCQPKGLAARTSNRKAREITDLRKYSSKKPGALPGFFFFTVVLPGRFHCCEILASRFFDDRIRLM